MSDTEKQEGQKTVVAFIAGLLIGGLLVWVFSSSPTTNPEPEAAGDSAPSSVGTDDSGTSPTSRGTSDDSSVPASSGSAAPATGSGSVTVPNQPAGSVVTLGAISFPTNDGWIAVREFTNETEGNILGAARYSIDAGLVPEAIQLLRSTETGKTYKVVFYSESGDRVFDLDEDIVITSVSTTFSAR